MYTQVKHQFKAFETRSENHQTPAHTKSDLLVSDVVRLTSRDKNPNSFLQKLCCGSKM